jgi:hypothetical protein
MTTVLRTVCCVLGKIKTTGGVEGCLSARSTYVRSPVMAKPVSHAESSEVGRHPALGGAQ